MAPATILCVVQHLLYHVFGDEQAAEQVLYRPRIHSITDRRYLPSGWPHWSQKRASGSFVGVLLERGHAAVVLL